MQDGPVVVGDVDPAALKTELERMTADIKPRPFIRHPRAMEPIQQEIRTAAVETTTQGNQAAHGIPHTVDPGCGCQRTRFDQRHPGRSRELKAGDRGQEAKTTGPHDFSLCYDSQGPRRLCGICKPGRKNIEATVRAIMDELVKLGKENPAGEELDRAKTNIEAQHIMSRETVQGMARNVGSFKIDLGDAHYEKKYLTPNPSVTPTQISGGSGKII